MNKTVTSTGLGDAFDELLKLCKEPKTPRGKIGEALRNLVSPECADQLNDRAAYWLIRAIALELYQPRSAPSSGAECMAKAKKCPDFASLAPAYAELRVEVLQARVNRSSASLRGSWSLDYERRLAVAKESPHIARTG